MFVQKSIVLMFLALPMVLAAAEKSPLAERYRKALVTCGQAGGVELSLKAHKDLEELLHPDCQLFKVEDRGVEPECIANSRDALKSNWLEPLRRTHVGWDKVSIVFEGPSTLQGAHRYVVFEWSTVEQHEVVLQVHAHIFSDDDQRITKIVQSIVPYVYQKDSTVSPGKRRKGE